MEMKYRQNRRGIPNFRLVHVKKASKVRRYNITELEAASSGDPMSVYKGLCLYPHSLKKKISVAVTSRDLLYINDVHWIQSRQLLGWAHVLRSKKEKSSSSARRLKLAVVPSKQPFFFYNFI
jgi:hypothetical protein